MSLNESRRKSRHERWPLEFDLTGIPRNTAIRKQLLAERKEQEEMSTNSFTVDKLSSEQKADLLNQLLQTAPVGREIDLGKPVINRYRFQPFPKMVYRHDNGHILVVQNERELQAALKRDYLEEPSPNHDYSQLSGSNHAALKVSAPREQEPMSAAELAELDAQNAQASAGEDASIEATESEAPEAEVSTEAEDRPSRRGRNR